jgi:hypothetical protein
VNKVPTSVSIDTTRPLTQKNLNEIEAFKASVKPNERIRIDGTYGSKIIFTRYKESGVDQGLRQIGNLIAKFKNAAHMNSAFVHIQLSNLEKKAEKNNTWASEIKKFMYTFQKNFTPVKKFPSAQAIFSH